MTNASNDTTTSGHSQSANRDYEVGYGKPPVAHRFARGNKANPKGRRKGARSRKVVVRDVLFEPVTVREDGETRKMPALEAVLKRMLAKALGGDNKAALAIIAIAQKDGLLTPEQDQAVGNMSENDLAIIEDAKRRLAETALEPIAAAPSPGDGAQ